MVSTESPTARANARAKGYLPGAKPPLEQMPEQKVTSLGQSHRSSKCQSKRLPLWTRSSPTGSVSSTTGSPARGAGRGPGGPPHKFLQAVRLWEKRVALPHGLPHIIASYNVEMSATFAGLATREGIAR